jgi:uncharacterized membrane protein
MTWHDDHAETLSPGDRIADAATGYMGSWGFITIQTAVITGWIVILGVWVGWDPYPFQLLTLALSLQAAYAAPLILMAANRQADRDRLQALHDSTILDELRNR